MEDEQVSAPVEVEQNDVGGGGSDQDTTDLGGRDSKGRWGKGNSLGRGGGPPIGNQNAMSSGLRASSLPRSARFIEDQTRVFRRAMRDAVQERTGAPATLFEEALLLSAVRHETRAQLAGRWLRIEGEKLDVEKRLALLKTISDASDQRDRCLQRLGLDRKAGSDPWASINAYTPQDTPERAPDPETTSETMDTASARQATPEKRTEGQGDDT